MNSIKNESAISIWAQYEKGAAFKENIGLYENVRKNENFYIGRQWEGVNAPDLEKPVVNILKRVVAYFISMLVSDDISAKVEPYEGADESVQLMSKCVNAELSRLIEDTNAKMMGRDAIRDAAVCGDACVHIYWDSQKNRNAMYKGGIRMEALHNTNVFFGNEKVCDVQRQPYIIISMRSDIEKLKNEAKENGCEFEAIASDRGDDAKSGIYPDHSENMATVLIKYERDEQTGHIWASKLTSGGFIRKKWDTGLELYPIAWLSWEKVRSCYHGQAAITGLIPNQIAINKLQAMLIKSVKDMAFPKIIYDATKLTSWSNKVGEAIGVYGNPNEAIANIMHGASVTPQIQGLINDLVSLTKETMGASDAAQGMISNPDNTSAIIAMQKATGAPLELQKMSYYQWIEDYIRIFIDMIRVYYGVRFVTAPNGMNVVDYSKIGILGSDVQVNVGAAAYWSELTQVQTADNLYQRGLMDAKTYLEAIPESYIRNKADVLDNIDMIKEQGGINGAVQ